MAILVEREPDAYPKTGTLTFEDYADNILRTVGKILENKKVRLLVEWSEVEEEDEKEEELDEQTLEILSRNIDF